MEDSIQLSDCDSNAKDINSLVSPDKNFITQQPSVQNTISHYSLAYSNSTMTKQQLTERSPTPFSMLQFESMPNSAHQKNQNMACNMLIKQQDVIEEQSQEFDIGRKTVNRSNEFNRMKRKINDLEHTLSVERIVIDELRNKITILKNLLEEKMDAEDKSILSNSKNNSNLDMLIHFKSLQGEINKKNMQIQQYQEEIRTMRNNKQNNRENSINVSQVQDQLSSFKDDEQAKIKKLEQEIQSLKEDKQSLFTYVEDQNKLTAERNHQLQILKQENQKLQQKQELFLNIERPKLIKEIQKKNQQIQRKNQEMRANNENTQKIEMEHQLIHLNQQQIIQSLKLKSQKKNEEVQTVQQSENQFIKAQLKLLKTQRDYYLSQYRNKIKEHAQMYSENIKLKVILGNENYI